MLNVATWAGESPYFKALQSRTNQKQIQVLRQAMVSYNKRLAPPFPWKAVNKIQDDIQPIMEYFVAGAEFVQNLLTKGTVAPFCHELLILVSKTSSTHKMAIPEFDDSDDSEEDEDEDKEDDDPDEEDQYFDGIKKRLDAHKCPVVIKSLDRTQGAIRPLERDFDNAFKELCGKMKEKYGGGKALNEYPRKKYVHSVFEVFLVSDILILR